MLVPLQIHLGRFGLCTGVQSGSTSARQHWSGQNGFPMLQCSFVKQAHSMLVSLQTQLWRFALDTGVQ